MTDRGDAPQDLYGPAYFSKYLDDARRDAWYRVERDRITQRKPDGGRILDVGCGLGLFLALFPDDTWEKYGVDISDFAIRAARARGIHVQEYASAYDYPEAFFDVIVFRGTVQHLETPFAAIKTCVRLLRHGGLMTFLSTPNANSICYKLFGTLPALSERYNYLIPSDLMMRNALVNFGMDVVEIRYPYLETPYARPVRDHLSFLLRCFGVRLQFPFWGNMMEMYAVKP